MITSMLEKAIEIEGLLRIIRDGNPLPETYQLLKSKVDDLAADTATLTADQGRQEAEQETEKGALHPEEPTADFVMATPPPLPAMPEVDFTSPTSTTEEQPLLILQETSDDVAPAFDITEIDLDLVEEDDILLSFEDMPAPAASGDNSTEPSEPEDTAPSGASASTKRDEEQWEPAPEKKELPRRQTRLKSAFSLNDRFLYARELFGGDMKGFDSTLELIEKAADYQTAEEYIYQELEWDPENIHTASFMEKLRTYFKEA